MVRFEEGRVVAGGGGAGLGGHKVVVVVVVIYEGKKVRWCVDSNAAVATCAGS